MEEFYYTSDSILCFSCTLQIGQTALIKAAIVNSTPIVELLTDRGANVDGQDDVR